MKKSISTLASVYIANLLISLHYFFVIYVNSSFIEGYVGEDKVGYLYIIGSLCGIALFLFFRKLLSAYGNVRLISALMILEILSLIGLAFINEPLIVIGFFIMHLVAAPAIYVSLDIFLEHYTSDEDATGGTRGFFLTMYNIAQLASPLTVGYMLKDGEYWRAYIASTFFLVVALIVLLIKTQKFSDRRYVQRKMGGLCKKIWCDQKLRYIFVTQNLLRFFYAWMVIYMPLYLSKHVGFLWSEIGIIFTIMLLPFLLFELPLGKLIDKKHNEKQIMIVGFVFMVSTVALIPFFEDPYLSLWAVILFMTRVGASFVDISTESYFFKYVDSKNATLISLFRAARPVSYVAAAVIASGTLLFLPIQLSFFILTAILFAGIYSACRLP